MSGLPFSMEEITKAAKAASEHADPKDWKCCADAIKVMEAGFKKLPKEPWYKPFMDKVRNYLED